MRTSVPFGGLSRQALAVWTVVFSLLLVFSGDTTHQVGSSLTLRGDLVSILETPKPVAVQVATAPTQRATDDRYGAGNDPFLPVFQTAQAFPAEATQSATVRHPDCPFATGRCQHSPRAPPTV